MSQHDFDIANQTASNSRADINNAFKALASLSSGATAPSTTYANMLWYDTANNILKMRTEADDAWIDVGTLNQSTNEFEVAGLTTLSEATWETGTSTTESLVSPAKVKAAIEALEGGGLTLLGTLTTTSGATQTLSGLDLSDYTSLRIVVDGVSSNTDFPYITLDGGQLSLGAASTDVLYGISFVDLQTGVLSNQQGGINSQGTTTTLTNASTSITFGWSSAASFDAGQILVYGEA